jgi:hypothetical protein
MGEEVGTMQFRVQRGVTKKREKERKNEYKEIYIYMRKEKNMSMYKNKVNSLVL